MGQSLERGVSYFPAILILTLIGSWREFNQAEVFRILGELVVLNIDHHQVESGLAKVFIEVQERVDGDAAHCFIVKNQGLLCCADVLNQYEVLARLSCDLLLLSHVTCEYVHAAVTKLIGYRFDDAQFVREPAVVANHF